MKSVSVSKYDKDYFDTHLTTVNYDKKVTPKNFKELHRQISTLIKWGKKDFIVDFGCGNGEMTFLLLLLYKCNVLGIDYSKDGIRIAKEDEKRLKKTGSIGGGTIRFMARKNNELPHLKNVDGIYLADVIEHLYDTEIELIMKKFSTWGNDGMKIIIHTDNNIYVKYIRPFFDVAAIITGRAKWKEVKKRNEWEKERHVNLTTPDEIVRKVKKFGFKPVLLKYSLVSEQKINDQLGPLSNKTLVRLILIFSKLLSSLLPSFYLVLEKQKDD